MNLKIGKTQNGNVAVVDDGGAKHCLIAKTGEFKTAAQFPDWVCQSTITGESPESAARQWLADEPARAAAQQLRWQIENERGAAVADFKNGLTPAKLRGMLAAAEKKAADEKIAKRVMTAARKAAAKLPARPACPIKGIGNAREVWPFDGHNRVAVLVLSAIPHAHRDEVCTARRRGNHFSFGTAISPEAAKRMVPVVERFSSPTTIVRAL